MPLLVFSLLVGLLFDAGAAFPANKANAADTNLAQGKAVSASSTWSSGYTPAQAADGSSSTRWSAANASAPQWLTVDFGQSTPFNQVVLKEYKSRITAYSIQYSSDGSNWTDAKTGTKASGSSDTTTTVSLGKSYSARYVRLYVSACADTPSLYELEVYRTPITVSTVPQLNSAIAAALPGETIVLADGTWTDVAINFNSAATASAPVTLKAETYGAVILTGTSTPYLIADGLYFKNGALSSGQVVRFNSNYGRLTNSAIVDYNPPGASTQYYWVYFDGSNNRLDHSFLKGKNHNGPLIGNDPTDSRYNKVDNNYIKDIPFIAGVNGREIFRIWGYGGNEELGSDGAFFTIESNLLENADGEGGEYISLKSNRNQVLYNTIRSTQGSLTLRSGNFNTVRGNFILGEGKAGTAGIRVSGQGHTVVNNYIADVSSFGLNLYAGEYIDADLTGSYEPILRDGTPLGRVPRYGWVKNGTFAHNTIVGPGKLGIEVGGGYKVGWPQAQRVLLPENNTIANNVVKTDNVKTFTSPVQDTAAPLNIFSFAPNTYQGNIVYGGANGLNPAPSSGITTADPLLSLAQDGLNRPSSGSPVINSAVGSYVTDDMDGQTRSDNDAGADEYFDSSAAKPRKPLTASDVGTSWTPR
ncbi:chondroitinase-B domain-containing protein [Paenibacillus hamazuiensis]|uniref:chondroitinase-B domain-containing protein n=1 Tax=Paenibacillus hamazuiensis TaxID=2936508 RepID=UPI00200C4DC6|nr:chondroitinase-B domain-containing protein [Paenibacillus hamazuiensis]